YLLGEVDFAGLQLKVCPAVLIPRPETEEMACMARDILRERTTWLPAPRILDAATGSGCLALAMKRWFPGAKVTGTDLSEEALTLAGENALRNGLDVKFVHADLLRPPPPGVQGNLHLILSNPPYVRWEEHQLMQPNVLEWEPHSALFAPDEDPLAFYRSLALWGKQLLVPGGMVLAELNEALGDETASIFTAAGYLNVGLARDFRGRIRFLKASLLCG
ncbi:MAG TPA: peptide chain release factor N(5)-glutamine methyltransferase, partial [Bacteroidales bacterium]|nr:peptide chain release factor N(5)-glutamine methyltransferase [Bacteroidales bacterium]